MSEQAPQVRFDAVDQGVQQVQARGNDFTTHLDNYLMKLDGVEAGDGSRTGVDVGASFDILWLLSYWHDTT